jgi:hypothetical protein
VEELGQDLRVPEGDRVVEERLPDEQRETQDRPSWVEHETGTKLTEPRRSITIRQRKTIGFVTIAKTMFLTG